MLTNEIIEDYIKILESELVPAMDGSGELLR